MTELNSNTSLSPEMGQSQHSRPFGILVVDDEIGVRGMLEIWLRNQGFRVWLASGGREAVAQYRYNSEIIDLVLLDVRMPDMDGPETLLALRELNPRIQSIFMSGDIGHYTVEQLRAFGAAAVLPKPFRLGDVAQVLRQ